uniref:Aminopeptidase n=1 Tax=Phlebotomus papatasi TaxID=29031 RepID=A0A1B0DJP5_PHLPP
MLHPCSGKENIMGMLWLLFLLLGHCNGFKVVRLNFKVIPSHYEITVTPYIFKGDGGPEWTFDAVVEITMKAKLLDVRSITLHAYKLNITGSTLTCDDDRKRNLIARHPTYQNETQLLTYELLDALEKDVECFLEIEYSGLISNDMLGLYRSTYWEAGKLKRLAVTQFEHSSARRFMPCFDEPEFKANFTLVVRRREYMRSWSNMPLERTDKDPYADFFLDTFHTTPQISPYHLAFMVSEYTNRTGEDSIGMITRPEMQGYTDYGIKVAVNAIKYFSEYFDFPYSKFMPKLDLVALPDFSKGAMENPGLITFREALSLYVPNKASLAQKAKIARVISHELAHNWFGNLVTCMFWSHLWLNEGFATYFEHSPIPGVEETSHLSAQFTINAVHRALLADSTNTTFPLVNKKIETQNHIERMFGPISYAKGASVIRMLAHHIGEENMKSALRMYIKDRQFKTASDVDLLRMLRKVAVREDNIDGVFYSFVVEPGYPVVTVRMNETRDSVTLTQKRYFSHAVSSSCKDHPRACFWVIPITYVSKNQYSFNDTTTRVVMHDIEVTFNVTPVPNTWIIFNVQHIGYYRVNYDFESWNRIIDGLKAPDHDGIHELNRAQIIDDLMNLARSDHIPYCTAFNMLEYLKTETSYIPWKMAMKNFQFIIYRTPAYDTKALRKYVLELIENIYKKLQLMPDPSDNQLISSHRSLILKMACKFGLHDCLVKAREQFNKFKKDDTYDIPVDIRQVVFCVGVREGGKDAFNFLWKRYKLENVETEQITILSALACTNTDATVRDFLDKIFSSDVRENMKLKTFTMLATQNPANYIRLWDY